MSNDRLMLKLFSFLTFILFLVAGTRLFYLQVLKHDFYSKLVDTQSSAKIVFTKDRGLIVDRKGRPLAQNRKTASLYTFGRNINDPEAFAKALQSKGIKLNSAAKIAIAGKRRFIWIERRVDIARAEALKKSVPELEYCFEDARFYPEGNMLAGILGFTGVDNQGLSGIEYYADKVLKGTVISVNTIRDSRGKLILFDDKTIKTRPDSAVYLTIDAQMQGLAERLLKTDLEKFQAKNAIALAVDVNTGEVIVAAVATASKKVWNEKSFVTSYLFEPGSIFKTVTFGYLIEKGLYSAKSKVNTDKAVNLFGHNIKDVHKYAELTQLEVFTKSSNIGTVRLTSRANKDDFYQYLLRSGFGQKTGVEGLSEESGVLREPKKWSGLSLASISIGQEIMVSPIQIVRYYAAVANGGVAVRPLLIDRYVSGSKVAKPKFISERIMNKQTAATLMSMLAETVDTGTGKRARTGMLQIGGKTGTAQIIDTKTKTYSKTDYVASFAGVFPVEDPRVAMIVVYENPRSSIYGGETGAYTFRKIAEQIAFFYDMGNNSTKVQYANR